MKTLVKVIAVAALTMGALTGCQQNVHPMDMTAAVQNAKTQEDHETLAAHYEQAAKDAQAKVDEHKKLLAQYKQHRYLSGKQAETFLIHCEALISSYQKAVDANTEMAKMHHQLAGSK